jgi:hypothetical protein
MGLVQMQRQGAFSYTMVATDLLVQFCELEFFKYVLSLFTIIEAWDTIP